MDEVNAKGKTDRERIIDRIRACLKLSQSSNEHEAAQALVTAHRLLAEYNLSIFEVGDAFDKEAPVRETVDAGVGTWRAALYTTVAKVNYCEYFTAVGGKKRGQGSFIGRPINIASARESARWLIGTLDRLAMFEVQKHCPENVNKLRYRNSWLLGASITIVQRLKQTQKEEELAADTKAMVVSLHQETVEAVGKLINKIVMIKRREPSVNGNAYSRGREAGAKVALQLVRMVK